MTAGPVAPLPSPAQLFGLTGQRAVIVGGAGRIGPAIAKALAGAGASVCLVDLREAAAHAVAAQIQQAGGTAQVAVADATSRPALEQVLQELLATGPAPQILVNCLQYRGAGFYSSRVEDYPLDAWNQVLAVNLTGTLLACQVFGGAMAASGGGSIVTFGSTYGIVSPDPRIYGTSGVNNPVSYGASKAAVIQLTRYLAIHWREQHVRVNCLVPGGVFDNQGPEFVAAYNSRTPLNRMATPDDYQGAVLFLASPASAYMTGSVLTVDGGWTAW